MNEETLIDENGNGSVWCDGERHYTAPQGRRHERNDDGDCYQGTNCIKDKRHENK